MIRNIKHELDATKWWMPKQTGITTIANYEFYFEPPICTLAEQRFLTYLLFFLQEKRDINQYISEQKVTSYDDTWNAHAVALHKGLQIHEKVSIPFGSSSKLILQGQLAGTVIIQDPRSYKYPYKAVRPLVDTPRIQKALRFENSMYEKLNNPQFIYYLQLLKQVKILLEKENNAYVPVLLMLLKQLQVKHDYNQIIDNSEKFKKIIS